MFVDATFDIVPSPFYQCLIIMVFDMSCRADIPLNILFAITFAVQLQCLHTNTF
jgi:hypothetical protein